MQILYEDFGKLGILIFKQFEHQKIYIIHLWKLNAINNNELL